MSAANIRLVLVPSQISLKLIHHEKLTFVIENIRYSNSKLDPILTYNTLIANSVNTIKHNQS